MTHLETLQGKKPNVLTIKPRDLARNLIIKHPEALSFRGGKIWYKKQSKF